MGLPQANNSPNRNVARPTASKGMAIALVENSTATTGLSNPVATTTPPSGTSVINTADKPIVRAFFGATTTDGHTVNFQFIGWIPLDTAGNVYYIPQLLAKGVATAGTMAMPTAIIAAGLFADTITLTTAKHGEVLQSRADNSLAALIMDVRNCLLVSVETDVGTATSAYVWATLGEEISNVTAT